jgi:hypothetical protein
MKVSDYYVIGITGTIIVFFCLSWFIMTGNTYYGLSQQKLGGNISLNEYNATIQSSIDTANAFEAIFNSNNIIVGAFTLIIKGLPSAAQTFFRGTIASMRLTFSGILIIFATSAIVIFIGIGMSIIVIKLITSLWDWIRGTVPGS